MQTSQSISLPKVKIMKLSQDCIYITAKSNIFKFKNVHISVFLKNKKKYVTFGGSNVNSGIKWKECLFPIVVL